MERGYNQLQQAPFGWIPFAQKYSFLTPLDDGPGYLEIL